MRCLATLSAGLSERLRIINYWSHQEALRRASVVLDTFPYGGCLTVLEVFLLPRIYVFSGHST